MAWYLFKPKDKFTFYVLPFPIGFKYKTKVKHDTYLLTNQTNREEDFRPPSAEVQE
jgi:hypothetical protein